MSRPLRVLAVSTDYPPLLGGIATLSSQMVREMSALGHQVKVLCGSPGGLDPVTRTRCDRVGEHFPVGETLVLRELRLARRLGRIVPAFDPDIIWCSTWFPGAAVTSLCRRPRRGRVLCFSAYASEILPNSAGLKQRVKALLAPLRRRALADADRIFAISSYTRRQVIRLGAPEDRVAVLPGGVSPAWFQVPRVEPEGPPRLATVARLDEHKGHDVVIQALPRLARRWPDLVYEIIGPGDDERLRRLAAACGVTPNVRFQGALPVEAVMRAVAGASVFVMPSREIPGRPDLIEGFGLAFLEAAAVGVPVVAGRSGGVPDAVLDEETGLLVDPCSVEDTGRALERLLEDRALAARLGAAARRRAAAEYTWPHLVRKMLELLEPHLHAAGRTC